MALCPLSQGQLFPFLATQHHDLAQNMSAEYEREGQLPALALAMP